MNVIHKDGSKLIVLGGALLHEEDHKQVMLRQKKTGQKFAEAMADYVKELREYLKTGERIRA
jgi:hypothetical protein